MLEEDETIMKEKEWQGIRLSSKAGQELTPISWRRFEDAKYFVAILLDNLTEASECQRYFLMQFQNRNMTHNFMLNRHRQNCCSYNLVVCIQGLDEEKSGKGRSIGKGDCHVETIIR